MFETMAATSDEAKVEKVGRQAWRSHLAEEKDYEALQELFRHHIDSIDYMTERGLGMMMENLKPVEVFDSVSKTKLRIWLTDPEVYPPQKERASKTMVDALYPFECRQAKLSYSGKFMADMHFQYDGGVTVREKINLGHLPIMLKVRRELSSYWPILDAELPEHIICKTIQMERGSSHNVVYLGNEGDIPIPTMTQNFAATSPSSAARLWRPAAQRNVRNQWSKLNSLLHEWSCAASSGRSHATTIVNFYLSQKYMDSMDFGVLSDMPNLRNKASYKLFTQQELCKGNLLSSYKDMVRVLTQMVQICKSMRCYVRGTSTSPLAQFSLSSHDGTDIGDCGGIPVFTFFSVASFEELALEITQMFISELNLKRLLVVEFLSICHEKDAETHGSQWSNELYKGEFDDLGTLNLYSEKTQEPNLPSLRNRNSRTSSMKSQRQQDSSVLQIYITSWLAEVNIDKCRIDEILGIVGGEMRVDFLEIFG